MGDLSKNFSRIEFACKGHNCCGNCAPVHPDLVTKLQVMRDTINKPIIISSGFRCNTHNKKEGGSVNSYHTIGMAADLLIPDGITAKEFYDLANIFFQEGGIGRYKTWIHVDIRGYEVRWDG